jgi:hypothetical protein
MPRAGGQSQDERRRGSSRSNAAPEYRKSQSRRRSFLVQPQPVGSHWTGDVLQMLLAGVIQRHVGLALQLIVGLARDEDAAGLGQLLKPR